MLDRSIVTSTRLQESNFVHNLMNNLVQYVNYTKLDLDLGRFSKYITGSIHGQSRLARITIRPWYGIMNVLNGPEKLILWFRNVFVARKPVKVKMNSTILRKCNQNVIWINSRDFYFSFHWWKRNWTAEFRGHSTLMFTVNVYTWSI